MQMATATTSCSELITSAYFVIPNRMSQIQIYYIINDGAVECFNIKILNRSGRQLGFIAECSVNFFNSDISSAHSNTSLLIKMIEQIG